MQHVRQQCGSVTEHSKTFSPIVQRKIGLEFQAYDNAYFYREGDEKKQPIDVFDKTTIGKGSGFGVQGDGGKTVGELELQTDAFDETPAGKESLIDAMANLTAFLASLNHQDQSVAAFSGGGYTPTSFGEHHQHDVRLMQLRASNFTPKLPLGFGYKVWRH